MASNSAASKAWFALIGIAFACTTILAYSGKPGWEWILFVAFIMCLNTEVKVGSSTDKE